MGPLVHCTITSIPMRCCRRNGCLIRLAEYERKTPVILGRLSASGSAPYVPGRCDAFILIKYLLATADGAIRAAGPLPFTFYSSDNCCFFAMPDLPLHYWYVTSSLGGVSVTLPLTIAIALWLAV